MKSLNLCLALVFAATTTLSLIAQQNRKSPHETVSTVLGDPHTGNRVTIVYGRPYTKDPKTGQPRAIWGSLVPWDKAYRLGADEATLLVLQKAAVLGNTLMPAGAYTLYLIPSETGVSKLAISTDIGKWGVPVDEKHDLARVEVKKEALDPPIDQLTISVEKDATGGGLLKIRWEGTQFSVPVKTPAPQVEFPQASPPATLKQRIGITDIEVSYSRPSARSRVMLGGNNPYGEVWRTGANSATRITFSTPVTIQGAPLGAGTYELFSIPGKEEWTVIFQKPLGQWGAYAYDPKNDLLRVTAKPSALSEPVETFTIEFNDFSGGSATLNLLWETTRVPLKVDTNVVGLLVPRVEAAMAAPGPKPYAAAAMFYADNNLDLGKASGWIDAAIAEHPDAYYLIYQKARILAKAGDKAGAEAAARQSLEMASKGAEPARSEYIRLNTALISGLK
jgi:hypothetical protein